PHVYQSADAGDTWSHSFQSPSLEGVTAIVGSPTDPSTVIVGTAFGIYKSKDAGANWGASNFRAEITSLVIHPRDSSVGYAGAVGFSYFVDYPSFAKSTDGGGSWEDRSPKPLGAVSAVAVDPLVSSTVYMGTRDYFSIASVGVLRSEDAGSSW